jgi:hypothetical protein
MASTTRYLVTGLAVTITLVAAGQAFAAEDEQVRIGIHVDNYAGVSRTDRSVAEAEVTRIFMTADVRVVWASEDDRAGAPGLHVRVQLLSRDMAMQKIKIEGLADTVFGRSAHDAGRAYIFTHRVANVPVQNGNDFRRLLGRVMAHEVGHLVLPGHSHSQRGIMRADLGVDSSSDDYFTTQQGVAIRTRLATASGPPADDLLIRK